MFLFIQSLTANGTVCGMCQMTNDSAQKIVAEVRAELSYDELVEVGLAPRHCETCES